MNKNHGELVEIIMFQDETHVFFSLTDTPHPPKKITVQTTQGAVIL